MDFNRKKDFHILEEIVENVTNLTKNKELKIKEISSHKFSDGFLIENNMSRKLITLNYKEERVALLGFSIKNRNIEIESIQGIKNTSFKHPSNWYQYLLTPFIASSLKVYENKERLSKYIQFKEISSGVLEGRIKEIERLLQHNSKYNQNITLNEKRKDYYKNQLELLNRRLILTKKIRDDYFTKEGFINLNKKKVNVIVQKYNDQIMKLSQIKRVKKLRKNKKNLKIRKK
jgi:hypothetical protein